MLKFLYTLIITKKCSIGTFSEYLQENGSRRLAAQRSDAMMSLLTTLFTDVQHVHILIVDICIKSTLSWMLGHTKH